MNNIVDNFFEEYADTLIGFRFNEGNKVVDFWLKNDWVVSEFNGAYIKLQKKYEEKSYYILYSKKHSFDELLNHFSNIVKYNLERERKEELLKLKINELESVFNKLGYEDLVQMHFTLSNKMTLPQGDIDISDAEEVTEVLTEEIIEEVTEDDINNTQTSIN